MSDRPILFSGEMVRAILAGRKTQTRRVVKPQAPLGVWDQPPVWVDSQGHWCSGEAHSDLRCPYGRVGDRLWVRETWNGTQGEGVAYRATDPTMDGERWRPSIFMPRWASRITLEVTDVRVQRVQDISDDDARAEGVTPFLPLYGDNGGWELRLELHKQAFAKLWDTINTKRGYGWDVNPWTWCISFEVTP